MTMYDEKDIQRVMRVSKLDRDGAEALLRRYDGRADRAISEGLGYERIECEPAAVIDVRRGPLVALQDRARGIAYGLKPYLRLGWAAVRTLALPLALIALALRAVSGGTRAAYGAR